MREADYSPSCDEIMKKFIIKFLSGRLNIKLYSRLSKKAGNFKDL